MRKFASIAVVATSLLLGLSAAMAQAPIAGKDYDLVSPAQPTDAKNKVEVVEFFSYGCPHCNDFEPVLAKWIKSQNKDQVEVHRIPVTFGRDVWVPLAKMYYTLEALGEVDRLHGAVFDAIHNQRVPLNVEATQFDWIASKGVDRKKYTDLYQSFTIQSKVARAQQIAAAFKISGVPTLAVNGKYQTSASKAGGFEPMLNVVDQLVATEKGGSKK